jgi:type III pantothenate kinase
VSVPSEWLVDLGHSRIKWAQAHTGRLIAGTDGACPLEQADALEGALAGHRHRRLWLSGQSNPEAVAMVATVAQRHGLSLHILKTGEANLPVKPAYPGLGVDRWLALQWSWLQSRAPLCVVDCGTAVTVDVVDGRGVHRGGWIMSGLAAMRNGLLDKARGLPRGAIEPASFDQPATDSATAIAAGTALQLIAGINRALAAASTLLETAPVVWLTGGDADRVIDQLDIDPRHDRLLVLRGLAMATEAA